MKICTKLAILRLLNNPPHINAAPSSNQMPILSDRTSISRSHLSNHITYERDITTSEIFQSDRVWVISDADF